MDYYLGLSVSRAVCTKAIRDFWSRGVIELIQTCRINKQIAKLNTLGTLTDKSHQQLIFDTFLFSISVSPILKKKTARALGVGEKYSNELGFFSMKQTTIQKNK